MKIGKLKLWTYRNKPRHRWFGCFSYVDGRLHHIVLGFFVLVIDYRSVGKTRNKP